MRVFFDGIQYPNAWSGALAVRSLEDSAGRSSYKWAAVRRPQKKNKPPNNITPNDKT